MASTDTNLGLMVTTGEPLDSKKLTWKIENFDQIRRSDKLISSQRLKIELGDNVNFPTEWVCKLEPRSDQNPEIKMRNIGVFLSLRKAPENCKDAMVSFEVKVDKIKYSCQYVRNFIKDGVMLPTFWGLLKVVPGNAKSEDILENGCLLIELELKLFPGSPSEKQLSLTGAEQVEARYMSTFSAKLQKDLLKLMVEPFKNVEMKIVSKDGVEITVVAAILSARSPVFEKMFQADMEEAKSGIVKITDLCSETVELLLQFIYTGTLAADWKSSSVLHELFYAAGKYQLPDLLAFFDEIAGKICTKTNAGMLTGIARKLGMAQAEKELLEFMRKNMSSLEDLICFAEDCTITNL